VGSQRPLGKLRRRWDDNNKIDFRKWELGIGDMDWIELAQDMEK
jgi:hypothetical protein